jgi:hypothetical protein
LSPTSPKEQAWGQTQATDSFLKVTIKGLASEDLGR